MTIHESRAGRRRIIGSAVAVTIVLLLLMRACSVAGGPVWGHVEDSETHEPIAGAIVVAQWTGAAMGPVHSPRVCFHVETAVSDAKGRYFIPPWLQPPRAWAVWGSTTLSDAYLPGYESVRTQQTLTESPEDVFMKKFVGTDAERFEYIDKRVFSSMSCDNAGASRRNLFAAQKAAIHEAMGLARSEHDRRNLEGMRIVAAEDWLAATPNFHETYLRPLENLPANVRRELE